VLRDPFLTTISYKLQVKTLYEALVEQGLIEPDAPPPAAQIESLVTLTGQAFADAVLRSEEFRLYIVEGLIERSIPQAVLLRLMDYASGWGKPVERLEHTGKFETVTEVRRVVVHASMDAPEEEEKAAVH
jgi:hypothetical protein